MKAITTLAVLALSLLVAAAAFADKKPGVASFKVEISGVEAGVVNVKTPDAKSVECPKTKASETVATYNLIDTFPLHFSAALKKAGTHVISSGEKRITFTGVSRTNINKERTRVTFRFTECK